MTPSTMADPQDLLALAAKVEEATGPDRELDQCIHELCVIGRPLSDRVYPWAEKYTVSLDAALKLVPEGWDMILDNFDGKRGLCKAEIKHRRSLKDWNEGDARTIPLALTAAALRARAAIREGESAPANKEI